MRTVEPSVTLVTHTSDPERVIERMGRICYQSSHKIKECGVCFGLKERRSKDLEGAVHGYPCPECAGTGTDKSSAVAFVKMILANGHESVIEHASASFSIITDRGVTHEIVRHRLASYSQSSTRYCNFNKDQFGKEITVVIPPGLGLAAHEQWAGAMIECERRYMFLIDAGCKPEIARSVLPNSLMAEIGMSANFREWRHFLKLRTSLKAHPQMRQVAEMIRAELVRIAPSCFEDIP